MLLLVCGLPGTGKSVIAKALCKKINATILTTDIIRKQLFNKPKYTEEEKGLVYKVLFLLTDYLLANKMNCILDGTFYKKELRLQAKKITEKNKTKLKIIECVCPQALVFERIRKRIKTGDASDADFRIYREIKKSFEPIKEKHLVIDTSKSLKELEREIELIKL